MAKNIKARKDDYAQWYLDVIKAAQLADYSPVKGCMVIRPEGFAIWEAIQRDLDRRFKETGHVNAYFPLLIPQSFLAKEAQHVEGFAMECALVTHTRLQKDPNGKGIRPDPASQLEEPLVVRPTSETIIGHMYAEWVQSYRDLPILINQWCNVMRWEMRTRLFLRTAEFLWQEGHTAHETAEQAEAETLQMLDVYADFAENTLALPVVKGRKTESEKFPGANVTYCIEALMQDGKALQAGTSHNLGQNFSKAFDIKFLGRDNQLQHAWTTSWGVSTRLIGAMIMAHSDDDGLVVPPRVAPIVAAIIPVYKGDAERETVMAFINQIVTKLVGEDEVNAAAKRTSGEIPSYFFDKISNQKIVVDARDVRSGDKQFHWEQRGVPFRFEVGPRDVAAGVTVLKRRLDRAKESLSLDAITPELLKGKLEEAQKLMFDKAVAFRAASTRDAATYDELKAIIEKNAGFVRCFYDSTPEGDAKLKAELKATVRCIPLEQPGTEGVCILSGKPTKTQVLIALAY
ncbi:MAG: His/Gly/Thr/Pro-type tRNA ligase C-terminal domain-containing protein [Tepidisphaeraceae bacterium]